MINNYFSPIKDFHEGKRITVCKLLTHKFNRRTNDQINPAHNPFTDIGFQVCILDDLKNLNDKIDVLQRQIFYLKKDILRLESQFRKSGGAGW